MAVAATWSLDLKESTILLPESVAQRARSSALVIHAASLVTETTIADRTSLSAVACSAGGALSSKLYDEIWLSTEQCQVFVGDRATLPMWRLAQPRRFNKSPIATTADAVRLEKLRRVFF